MNEFVTPDPVPHTAPMPPSPDLVLKHLPPIFRLQSLTRLPGDTRVRTPEHPIGAKQPYQQRKREGLPRQNPRTRFASCPEG